jgi:uncharacterized damage-inducible protein DinB
MRPDSNEYAHFYAKYIDRVSETNIREAFDVHSKTMAAFLATIPESKADFAYAPGKWTVKQSLQHVIDTERVFAYRLLRVGRGDKTALPGFEQDDYAIAANVSNRTVASLAAEMNAVRQSTLALLQGLSDADLAQIGTASNNPVSANALVYIILGHWLHHQQLFAEQYGV